MTVNSLSAECEALVRDYTPLVNSLCRRMIHDSEQAQDAAQEVWLEVFKSLPGFRRESKVSTWMYTIARRTIYRWVRNEKATSFARFVRPFRTEALYVPPSPEPDAMETWVRQVCDGCLTAIVRCLEAEARFVYLLRWIARLEYAEIALVVGKSEITVRQSFSRSSRRINRFGKAECALFHPQGTCRCRMKPFVEPSQMIAEFKRLRRVVGRVRAIQESEVVFSSPTTSGTEIQTPSFL